MKQTYCLLFVGFYLSFLAILLNSSVIFAQSNSVLSLGISSVGSSSVPPNIIFLETKELRPTFKGTASANSAVTVEIEGNKNTTKAESDGQWEWTPLQDLKLGELELKISSGAQSKLFRLKVLSASKVLDSGKISATPPAGGEASPESSPRSIFEQDQVAVSQPTSSPTAPTSAPSESGFLSTLQNYLPFILGAFAIGILLFIVSRLLKPKPSASPMPEPTPPNPSPELNPTPIPAPENIPPPANPQTPPTWQPPTPETIATFTAPSESQPMPPPSPPPAPLSEAPAGSSSGSTQEQR